MPMKNIHIAFAADSEYAQHLGVAILSLLDNTEDPAAIVFHLADCGLKSVDRDRISLLAAKSGAMANFYTVDVGKFVDFPLLPHVTSATYARLDLPAVLPPDIDRLIYLDCDLLVLGDIGDLWRCDLEGFYFAAVEEPGVSHQSTLGMPIDARYFNAGVMLIDLAGFRKGGVMGMVLEYLQKYPERIRYVDQDALNAVLFGKWLPLPEKWNYVAWHFTPEAKIRKQEKREENKPEIIHFTASPKPWHYMCEHPYRTHYIKYLRTSPWKAYRFPDISIRNLFRKNLRSILPLSLRVAVRRLRQHGINF